MAVLAEPRSLRGTMWRARLTFQEVLPDLLPVYQRHGFCVLKIGEEGLVDLERFATHTSRQRAFRKPRQHLEAAGYRVTREPGPHPENRLDEAQEVSEQ